MNNYLEIKHFFVRDLLYLKHDKVKLATIRFFYIFCYFKKNLFYIQLQSLKVKESENFLFAMFLFSFSRKVVI